MITKVLICFLLITSMVTCLCQSQTLKYREITTTRKDTFVYERIQKKIERIIFSEYYNKKNEPISIWLRYIPEIDSIVRLDYNFKLTYVSSIPSDLLVLDLRDKSNAGAITYPVFIGENNNHLYQIINRDINYPLFASRIGYQGTVEVLYRVSENGDGYPMGVIKGITPPLDKEALRVLRRVKKWYPARKDGLSIECYVKIVILFKLEN